MEINSSAGKGRLNNIIIDIFLNQVKCIKKIAGLVNAFLLKVI
jgi:hypothetical protein